MNVNKRLEAELNQLKEQSLLRELRLSYGLKDFCSNDYLGISLLFNQGKLVLPEKKMFSGSGGSRLLAGNFKRLEELEKLLAEVHRKEKALVFNSGYSANLGFFSTIPSKNSITIFDEKIHACIKDGMRLSLAKKTSFRHNDLDHLEQKLRSNSKAEIFVAVESIYSMDGDEAPLVAIAQLCEKYGAYLVVDEAHSTGVYGAKGAGLVSQFGLDDLVYAKIHTFGKAIGCHGACVVGDSSLIDYLINKSRPFIYTTALSPHTVETLLFIYGYLTNEAERLQNEIKDRIEVFKASLRHQEIKSNSPIQVVLVSGNKEVKRVATELQSSGFDVRPVLSPTVKAGEERLRICLHNFNDPEEVRDLAKKINDLT